MSLSATRALARATPASSPASTPAVNPGPAAVLPEHLEALLTHAQRDVPLDADLEARLRRKLAGRERDDLTLIDAGFERQVQLQRNRFRAMRSLLADGAQTLEFAGSPHPSNPTCVGSIEVFSRDPTAEGRAGRAWRITTFTPDGPWGHRVFTDLDEAARALLHTRGVLAPGVVDAWTAAPEWAASHAREQTVAAGAQAPKPSPPRRTLPRRTRGS